MTASVALERNRVLGYLPSVAGDKSHRRKLARHCGMLFFFILGAVTGTVFCHLLVGRAIWLTMIPLGIIFLTLLHADRTTEKELVEQKPAGH